MSDDDLPPLTSGVPQGRLMSSVRFKSPEVVAAALASHGLPPVTSGVDPDLQETYWKPFRYSPEIDEALCFGCEKWLGPEAFRLSSFGVPHTQCRA